MNPPLRSFVFALLALGVSACPLHAQFKFGNGGGDGRWSNGANWTGGNGRYPAVAGVGAEMATSAEFKTILDVDTVVGTLRNTAGSARIWTIVNDGGFTLTLDHTGGLNFWGNRAAEIRAHSSGGIVCAANLRLRGTHLEIGSSGSNHVGAQITLSGSITADDERTITVRNNRRQTNLRGDIGTRGAGSITLVNLSNSTSGVSDPNQLVISGRLGGKVVQLTQGEGVSAGMLVSGDNPDFRGKVSVLANTLTVDAGGTLGDFNTVVVSNGARLVLQGAKALGLHASLEIDSLGAVALNYAGTRIVDALSLDGGMTFASPGSTWGAPGSGVKFVSRQLEGTGLLQVASRASPAETASR